MLAGGLMRRVNTFSMYPTWPVEWAGESLRGECLAGSRVNTEAPACPTGASWLGCLPCVVSQVLKSRMRQQLIAWGEASHRAEPQVY